MASTASAAQAQSNYNAALVVPANKAFIEELFAITGGGITGLIAGTLAGAMTMGLLAIPVAVTAGLAGEAAGRALGTFFYNNFTQAANEMVEWIAPMLAPVGDGLSEIGDVIEDVVSMVFGAVTDAFEYISDQVVGADGFLGLNGPLFGPDGPLHGFVSLGQEKGFLTHEGEWAYDGFDTILYGTDVDDILILDEGTGAALGGKGDDVLLGVSPRFVSAGSPLIDGSPAPLAGEDTMLELDGGEGADWVITVGGERAVTAGGLGRDWIYNTSDGGVIWGDVIGGLYEKPVTDAAGNPVYNADGTIKTAPGRADDTAENGDNIWYAPNVKVMDAQHSDVLKFYGFTLTGGDANGGLAAAMTGGLLGAVAGGANFAFSGGDWRAQVYFDHLLPWMTYMFQADEDGNLDMYITNQFDQLFQAVFGGDPGEEYERRQALAAQGIHAGWMKIENVDVAGSIMGKHQAGLAGQGDFNMVFRAANPIWDILAALPPTLITFAGSGGGPLVDAAFSTAASNDNEMSTWPERPLRFG